MKAVVYNRYGPPEVLRLEEVEKPAPGEREVLVKVHATTVNRTDYATINAIPFAARLVTGLFRPKKTTPGTEFAGVVEQAGAAVTGLKPGDRVFGFDDQGSGAHAEYLAVSEKKVLPIPKGISFEQAAASSEGAHYARNFINKVPLVAGSRLLVNGATGAIGSAAVQLAKSMGAEVTAVCEGKNAALVKSIGAARVIDYTKADFTRDGRKFDFVFDAVGKSSFFRCWRLLGAGGVYISSDLGFLAQNIFLPLITPIIKPLIGNRKTIFPFPADIPASLALVKTLTEQGKFKPVIDRKFPLEKIVEAYRYVGTGQKKGNVVITVAGGKEA